jgi:hypothetical protein
VAKPERIDDLSDLDIQENVVEIDETNLARDWSEQAPKMLHHTLELAKAKRDLDYAKADLEVADSDLDRAIRLNPDKYGIDKITEKIVENCIIRQKKHIECNRLLIEARYKVSLLQAVVDALEHRKKALENRVHLWAAGYFAEPREKDTASRELIRDATREQVRRPIEGARKK